MNKLKRCAVISRVVILSFALFVTVFASAAETADTIVTNAKVYTVNPQQKWAEAIAVRGENILAVGDAKQIDAYRGASTKVIDAKGHLVLPGFTDCHVHFMSGSLGLTQVDLNGANTVEEIQKRVKEYAAAHPNLPWITGMGWQYPVFGPTALPTKKMLDDAMPDRAVYLVAYDGHSSWANSKALTMAGIDQNTPDPPNGKIVRDSKGEATGALKEAAGDLVERLMPKPTREERLAALRKGFHQANQLGVVRVHSAGGDFEYLDLYDELRKNGELTVRQYIAYFLDPPELTPASIEKMEAARKKYNDAWISGGAVKTMLDGVIEAHTAAVLGNYADDTTQSGKLFWDPDKYKQAITEIDKRGFQIFTHAIGDRAVRLAFDAYENAQKTNHISDDRPRIEHIETITAQDIPRFGKLGVIASFQPLHTDPNDDTLKVWAVAAGPDRVSRAWPWRSVEKSGGKLAFGSDWPVVTISPWPGVQNALTRQTAEGEPAGGWIPQERISLEDAIQGYTLGAAFAGRREKTEGSLEPGKVADLIILSKDLFKIEPPDVLNEEVLVTFVGGKVVYESANWTNLKATGTN